MSVVFVFLTISLTGIVFALMFQRFGEFLVGDTQFTTRQFALLTVVIAVLCLMWARLAKM